MSPIEDKSLMLVGVTGLSIQRKLGIMFCFLCVAFVCKLSSFRFDSFCTSVDVEQESEK